MKRLGIALILTCALSVSALAGDVPTVGIASTPPPPPPGDISTPGVASPPPLGGTQSTITTTILLTVLNLIR